MSVVDEHMPTLPIEVLPVGDIPARLSGKDLLDDWRSFAYNNPRFASGQQDEIYIRASTTDKIRAEVPITTEGFKYLAARTQNEQDPKRPILSFSVSALATIEAVQLPPHLATILFPEMETPAEAVKAAGAVTLEREKKFSISTVMRQIVLCDSYVYSDKDGNILNAACSCPPEAAEDDEEENTQVFFIDAAPQATLQSYDELTTEEGSDVFLQLMEAEAAFAVDSEMQTDQNLREAFASFLLFKQGLRQQLGL